MDARAAQIPVRRPDHGVDAVPQLAGLAGVLIGDQPTPARPRVVDGGEAGRGHQLRDVGHPFAAPRALLLLGELLALADVGEDVPGVLGHHARELTAGTAREAAVGWIRGVAGDAGQRERRAVEPVGVPAAVRHVDRAIRHRFVEVGPVQRAVDHLRVVEHEAPHPPAGRRVEGLAPQGGLDLADRPQVRVHAVELVHAAGVRVGVDEPRRDGHAPGVDHLGVRTDEVPDVVGAAHGDEPASADRERLRAGLCVVDGVDPRVDHRQIRPERFARRLLRRRDRQPGRAGPAGQHRAEVQKLLACIGGHRSPRVAKAASSPWQEPAAFERRCIPPWTTLLLGRNMPNMLPRRALPRGRLTALGATRGFTSGCWRRY